MNTEQPFAVGEGLLHQLDPRIKIASAAVYSVVVAVLTDWTALGVSFAFSLSLLSFARLSPRRVLARLAIANGFLAVLWLVLPWSVPGEVLARWGPIAITAPGLRQSLAITLKCNAILMALIALLGTSELLSLAHALERFHVPQRLLMIVFFCLRYLAVIGGEYRRLTDAMKVRGFKPRTDLRTYRTYAYLLAMLFVRSHDRALRIYQAMVCRGFRGAFPVFADLEARGRDWLTGGVILCVTFLLGVLQWRATIS